jgi:hypothetical protein
MADAILTEEQRRTLHRPITIDEMRSAARRMRDQSMKPRDIGAALQISELAVIALLEGKSP